MSIDFNTYVLDRYNFQGISSNRDNNIVYSMVHTPFCEINRKNKVE